MLRKPLTKLEPSVGDLVILCYVIGENAVFSAIVRCQLTDCKADFMVCNQWN